MLESIYDCVYFMNIFWPVGSFMKYAIALITSLLALFTVRAAYLSYKIITTEIPVTQKDAFKLIICIGSGGHTTEMIEIVKSLNATKYRPRLYIVADNDTNSEDKIRDFENGSEDFKMTKIPRCRNVNQSYITSIFSTIHSIICTIPIVYRFKPDTIVCNGPGTCIPICATGFFFRCLYMMNCRIVFVESVCRVRSLSLSGKILQYIADIFVVQWRELKDKCFRAQYYGRLT